MPAKNCVRRFRRPSVIAVVRIFVGETPQCRKVRIFRHHRLRFCRFRRRLYRRSRHVAQQNPRRQIEASGDWAR